MKIIRVVLAFVIMIFLVQQTRKIMNDPGYIGRVVDMITDGTSAEIGE